jgi:hypothetical protein
MTVGPLRSLYATSQNWPVWNESGGLLTAKGFEPLIVTCLRKPKSQTFVKVSLQKAAFSNKFATRSFLLESVPQANSKSKTAAERRMKEGPGLDPPSSMAGQKARAVHIV